MRYKITNTRAESLKMIHLANENYINLSKTRIRNDAYKVAMIIANKNMPRISKIIGFKVWKIIRTTETIKYRAAFAARNNALAALSC